MTWMTVEKSKPAALPPSQVRARVVTTKKGAHKLILSFGQEIADGVANGATKCALAYGWDEHRGMVRVVFGGEGDTHKFGKNHLGGGRVTISLGGDITPRDRKRTPVQFTRDDDDKAIIVTLPPTWLSGAVIGKCQTCKAELKDGDSGYQTETELYCDKHAPTWGNIKASWKDTDDADEDKIAALATVQAHLESGGSLADRVVETLES